MRGRPPVGLSFELIPRGWSAMKHLPGRRWPHGWRVAAASTQGRPPKKQNTGPNQALPWPLLARAYPYDPRGSKGTRWEDTFTPESLSGCALCVSSNGMWGVKGDKSRGAQRFPETPSLVFGCMSRRPQRESVRQKERDGKRERHGKRNLSF